MQGDKVLQAIADAYCVEPEAVLPPRCEDIYLTQDLRWHRRPPRGHSQRVGRIGEVLAAVCSQGRVGYPGAAGGQVRGHFGAHHTLV